MRLIRKYALAGIIFLAGATVQAQLVWYGGDGLWRTNGTLNWNNGKAAYTNGAPVIFNDAATSSTVNLSGVVEPGSMTVSNTVNAYTFSGSGTIGGTSGLTKLGNGLLTLNVSNSFTGGVYLTNAGTLYVNNAAALGAANGNVFVTNSILEIGANNSPGITVAGITNTLFAGGTLCGSTSSSGSNVWAGPVVLAVDKTKIITEVGGNLTVSGRIAAKAGGDYGIIFAPGSNGTITLSGAGNMWDNGVGTYSAINGSGTVALGVNNALATDTYIQGGGGILDLHGHNQACTGLVAWNAASVIENMGAAPSTLTVTTNTSGTTWIGTLQDGLSPLSLVLAGTQTLTLSGVNAYSGATTIRAGTLALSGYGSISNSTPISISSKASFDVTGLSNTFALQSSQTLSNNAASTGLLAGNLNASAGTISVSYTNGTPVFTVANGVLTISSNTVFNLNNTGPALARGTYLIITNVTPGSVGGIAGSAPAAVTVSGGGIANGAVAVLQIGSGNLVLQVANSFVASTTTIALHPGWTANSVYGAALQFDVTVTGSNPTGTVIVRDGGNIGTAIGAGTISGGLVTITESPLNSMAAGLSGDIVAVYGGDNNNLGSQSSALASQAVIPKALTVTGAAAQNKSFDGTVAATITGTLNGVVGSDSVILNGTGNFANPWPGTNIAVTSTSTLGGPAAANYTLTQPTGLTADIVELVDTNIDDFEQANPLTGWTVSYDTGATGSLATGVGYVGTGLLVNFDLSQGGTYVAANYALPSPISPFAIGFWVQSPPNIEISLQVVDASGQILQYDLNRPAENLNANSWYEQVVPLADATSWSGGADNGQVAYPITSIAILADRPLMGGPAGVIGIDNITAVYSPVFNLNPVTQPLVPAPSGSGNPLAQLSVSFFGDPYTSDVLGDVKSAGFNWLRTDLTWAKIETVSNVYNWTAYDTQVNTMLSNNITPLLVFDYGNALYTGTASLPPTNAAAIAGFANYASAAASHFAGRCERYEIWPEPVNVSNGYGQYGKSMSWMTAQYAALCQAVIPALHKSDSNALVIACTAGYWDWNFYTNLFNLGCASWSDIIGIHNYPVAWSPGQVEDQNDGLLLLRSLISENASNPPPLWITEGGFSSALFGDGYSTSNRSTQALMDVRLLLNRTSVGYPLQNYYQMADWGTNSAALGMSYGLLDNAYNAKPALTALQTLASVEQGRRFSGFIHARPTTLNAMRFDGRTNLVVAVWNDNTNSQVVIMVPTNTTAMDYLGNPLTLLSGKSQQDWVLYESNGPIYFTFPGTWQATNLSPVLAPISNQIVIAGSTLVVTNEASFQNAPTQSLSFSYSFAASPVPPAGTSINAHSGIFTWRPTMGQANTTNLIGIVVSDGGSPSLEATQYFTTTVVRPISPAFANAFLNAGALEMQITGASGPNYLILGSTNLINWTTNQVYLSPSVPFIYSNRIQTNLCSYFYKVILGP